MSEAKKNHTRKVLTEVHGERLYQDNKWGVQNHDFFLIGREQVSADYYREMSEYFKGLNDKRVAWYASKGYPSDRNCTWDTILLEEIFEALAETDPRRMRAELVQAAAVIVAMIERIDRVKEQTA